MRGGGGRWNWRWWRQIGEWKPIAKEAIDRGLIFVKFLCVLHVTDSYLFSSSIMLGPSMLPTLNLAGDVCLIESLSTRLGKVGPGDIVMVRSPENPRKMVSKRILAMEGDIVTYVVDPNHNNKSRTIMVPKGHVWIQGDNIYASTDSRHYGPVPYGLIQGRVFYRVWPLEGFGSLGHRV